MQTPKGGTDGGNDGFTTSHPKELGFLRAWRMTPRNDLNCLVLVVLYKSARLAYMRNVDNTPIRRVPCASASFQL